MKRTRTGIERVIDEKAYQSSRVGLVTNPTGILADGRPTWKALMENDYQLRAIFGPEHGFRGDAQDAVEIEDEHFRGVQVYSLYGVRERPEPYMLEGLDCVLYDIQDVGCRYYTYLYTLAYTMEACEQTGTKVVVLDRPDPIRADVVEGNPIEAQYDNFVGGYGLAPRYGMTVGEFAHYLKQNYFPGIDLEVWWMEDYERSMYFESTGLPWPLPSPNLPRVDAAILYPGTCLLEGTNLSEGRGTTRPFEIVGAPWMDGERLRDRLAEMELPGLAFSHLFFTPTMSKHGGELCEGVLIHVVDRDAVSPLHAGLAVISEIAASYPDRFEWRALWEDPNDFFMDRLAGGPMVREAISAREKTSALYSSTTNRQHEFMERREKALHY